MWLVVSGPKMNLHPVLAVSESKTDEESKRDLLIVMLCSLKICIVESNAKSVPMSAPLTIQLYLIFCLRNVNYGV